MNEKLYTQDELDEAEEAAYDRGDQDGYARGWDEGYEEAFCDGECQETEAK